MSEPILSKEQLILVKQAIGDGSDWPRTTSDPAVNWAVDCRASEDFGLEHPPWDEALYRAEIEAR